MSRVLVLLGVGALVVAALVYPVALIVAGTATDAYLIAAKDKSAVEVERQIFEAPKGASKDSKAYRDAVMSIYGSQTDEPTKVVFVPADKFLRPPELPTLVLLPIDKQQGENPLQVKTVFFFATRIALGAAVVGIALLGIGAATRKKRAPAPPPPA
ncbi:MAG TPA: hypothetical protein VG457_10405 [Planctomycetota bacterium]|jgi:hypothetical protein|nr:hypothetical protein [Planctomycetota bacterium]